LKPFIIKEKNSMKVKSRITILVLLAAFAGAYSPSGKLKESGAVISPVSDRMAFSDGSLIYGLPLSVLDIKIDAVRIIEKPGPYARFAEDYLGLRDVIKTEREYWKIRTITVSSHSELDPSQFYMIETSNTFRTNALTLKKEGLILDLNPDLYNNGARYFAGAPADYSSSRLFDLGADEYFQERRDTAYKVVNVDTAFIRIPYLVEKKQKLSYDQLAERAARRLMEMRDGKHLILSGETNVFPQNEYAINEMNRMEKEYTDLFAGKIWRESHSFQYQIIPEKGTTGRQITICRFSETSGPTASAGEGTPLMIEFLPESKTRRLEIINRNTSSSSSRKSRLDKLYYRVPEIVQIKITYGGELLNNTRHLIYQFGEVVQLPSNFIIGK